MADTFTTLNPLDTFAAEQDAAFNQAANPEQTAQTAPLTARLTPRLRGAFEQVAAKHDVPVNVVMAIASRDSDFDQYARDNKRAVPVRGIIPTDRTDDPSANPFVPEEAIDIAARKIRAGLDAGHAIPDILKAFARDNDPGEYSADVARRAMEIGKELYPDQFAPPKTNAERYDERSGMQRHVTDRLRSGGAGVVAGHKANLAANAAGMLEVMDRIDAGEQVPEVDDPMAYAYMTPEQRKEARAHLAANMGENLTSMAGWEKYRREIPYDENVAKAASAKTFGEFWDGFSANPAKFIAHITMESAPAMAPGMLTGGAVGMARGGAAAVAGALGASSYAVDMGASIMEALGDKGVDTANPDAVAKALSDPKLLKEIRQQAHAHAAAVGAFDGAAGLGIGGVVEKAAGKGFLKGVGTAAKEGVKEIPKQAALGMGGELSGQVASGDDIKVGAVLAEGLGEIGGTVGHVGAVAAGRGLRSGIDAARSRKAGDKDEPAAAEPAPAADPAPAAAAGSEPDAAPEPAAEAPKADAPEPEPEAAAEPSPGQTRASITDEHGTHAGVVLEDAADGVDFLPDGESRPIFYPRDALNSGAVRITTMEEQADETASVSAPAGAHRAGSETDAAGDPAPAPQADAGSGDGANVSGGVDHVRKGANEPELTRTIALGKKPRNVTFASKNDADLFEIGDMIDLEKKGGGRDLRVDRFINEAADALIAGGQATEEQRAEIADHYRAAAAGYYRAATSMLKANAKSAKGKLTVPSIQEAYAHAKSVVESRRATQDGRIIPEGESLPAVEPGGKVAPAPAPESSAALAEPAAPSATPEPAPKAPKPPMASKAEQEHLFGIPAKREAALKRIAGGRAWFGDKDRARAFITKNGLKDTHEAVQTGKARWEAKEKAPGLAAVAEATAPTDNASMQEFAPETGTLGIPRSEMPQVEAGQHKDLVRHLDKAGIETSRATVEAADLKPTQAEFSPEKVEAARESGDGKRAVLVSNDGHIVDGHHQAVAAAQNGEKVKTIQIDAPIEQALEAVKQFADESPKSEAKSPKSDADRKPAAGAANTVFTADAAEKARALIRSKLTQLNSGIDPELMQAGITLAGYHIEAGARSFAAYAKAMTEDLGDIVRPYLKSWYMGVKYDPRAAGFDGMSGAAEVDAADVHLQPVAHEDITVSEQETAQEDSDAGTSVRGDGSPPLGGMASEHGSGDEAGGPVRAGASAGEQAVRGDGRGTDGAGVSEARSGGSRRKGSDPAGARARAGRSRVKQDEATAVEEAPAQVERTAENASAPNIPAANFTITDDLELGKGSLTQKYQDNLTAIRTLKEIEAAGRRATPEEQKILARYVGWGGLKNAFRVAGTDRVAKGWEKRVDELESLLTPEELAAARNSTTAAHYTAQNVVEAMWSTVQRLGFNRGAVLEPSAGSGNFLGLAPAQIRDGARFMAVEYDSLTARIASKLYPQATVLHSPFERVPLPAGKFSLAIGNPPFGRESLRFSNKPIANGHSIHNQFFIASLDALEPGGLLSMVVSHNLMDALSTGARTRMAEMGEFLGAVRLPSNAFKENANTEVVTDIIFLRRRTPQAQEMARAVVGSGKVDPKFAESPEFVQIRAEISSWLDSHKTTAKAPDGTDHEISLNRYFQNNPDQIVGTLDASGTMNRRQELNVTLEDVSTLQKRMDAALANVSGSFAGRPDATMAQFDAMAEGMRLALRNAREGDVVVNEDGALKVVLSTRDGDASLLRELDLTPDTPFNTDYDLRPDGKWERTVDVKGEDGKPLKVVNEEGKATKRNQKETIVYDSLEQIPAKDRWGETRIAQVRDMVGLIEALRRQLVLESKDAPTRSIDANRARLNKLYDAFVKANGEIHKPGNLAVSRYMPDGALLEALEVVSKDGSISRAAILDRRVVEPPRAAEKAGNPGEAVAISLSETGRIDIERIASLLGTSQEEAEVAISEGDARAFMDPEKGEWVPRDEYLSGLVRRKLNAARAAGLESNVTALEAVIPPDWDATDITPSFGSGWIPAAHYAAFLKSLGYGEASAHYNAVTNSFTLDATGQAAPEWQTSSMSILDIARAMANSRPVVVRYTDSEGKTHINEEATAEAQAKGREMADAFMDWAFADGERRRQLVEIFNEKFNTRLNRQRDGSHLKLPGKVPDAVIKMRRHQMNAIWRGITDRAVLFDHVVGAGKTYTAIARIMERRRMGLSRKPMVAVPNHLVEQWGADVRALYPGANILAATKKDFEAGNRRRLFGRIATGDYDMVIVGHSSFGFIPLDPAVERQFIEDELREAMAAKEEAEEIAKAEFGGWGKPPGVRDAEFLIKKLEARLARVNESMGKDRLVTFEEMGVDDLTVDEAHEFKNLAYSSNLQNVAGMGNKSGSAKAMDVHLKTRSLHASGGSIAFLTGTPISNSVAEMYLVLKNLAPAELKEMGLDNFDAWRTMFVSAGAAWEPTEAGGLKEVTRLGREWSNMRSLMDLYYSVTDAVTMDDIKAAYAEDNGGKEFPVPKVKGEGDRAMIAVKPSPEQRRILKDIVEGFESLSGYSDPKEKNAARLRLMDKARKVSLDPRAVDPRTPVKPGSGKIGAVVDNVERIYRAHAADKGTQIVFLDRSVPKAKGDDKIVVAYDKAMEALEAARAKDDEAAEAKAVEALEKFNPSEVEALRDAQNGGWNAYQEIKDQLTARGIPADEIRFVQEANTDEQKKALFDRVKRGDVRVIIGSTPRMGAGTNVQDLLVGLHHVDVTWKPSDIEQREGRIVRQGNKLLEKHGEGFEVEVLAYATEMTVDAKMWSLNATKLKALNGIRKYDGSFNMEFEDEEAAGMAEMAALATGNPLMVERVTLDGDINKLMLERRSYNRRLNAMRDRADAAQRLIDTGEARAAKHERQAVALETGQEVGRKSTEARRITIAGESYADRQSASAAFTAEVERQRAGEANARYRIDVNGETVTSLDAFSKALDVHMGTSGFVATIDGAEIFPLAGAAEQLAGKLTKAAAAAGSELFSVDGFKINGMGAAISTEPGPARTLTDVVYEIVDTDGSPLVEYRQVLRDGQRVPSAMAVRNGIEKLMERMAPDAYRSRARRVLADRDVAIKDLPALREQADKQFPKQSEIDAKNARLQEVVSELAKATDSARLTDDAEGVHADIQVRDPSDGRKPVEIEGLGIKPGESISPHRKAIRDDLRTRLAGQTFTTADGHKVGINWQGIKHATAKANPDALAAARAIDRLLPEAVKVGEGADYKGRDNVLGAHLFDAPAVIDGKPVTVKIVVRETADGQFYYDQAVISDEKGKFASPGLTWGHDNPGGSASIQLYGPGPAEENVNLTDRQIKANVAVNRLVRQHAAGNIDADTFASGLHEAMKEQRAARQESRFEKAVRGRERGADIVREKLLAARRRGQTDPDGVDIVLWALDRNPAMADDLAISMRENKNPDDMTAAFYNGANMITLFKDKADAETAIHEILHHTERMMKPRVRDAILAGYARAIAPARRKASPKVKALLDDMLAAQAGDKEAVARVMAAFRNGDLSKAEHYQFFNPSEWWAVNAARLLSERHAARGSAWAIARNWLKDFIQKARDLFGLSSTAPVIRGLNAVLNGDHTPPTGRMLSKATMLADVRQDSTHDNAQPSRSERLQQRMTDLLSTFMTGGGKGGHGMTLLGATPVRALFKELANGSKAASAYMDTKQEMDTERNQWHELAHKVTTKWRAYARKNGEEADRLSDLMHEATLAQVDPAMEFRKLKEDSDVWALANSRLPGSGKALDNYLAREEDRKNAYASLRKKWEAMSPEAQALYEEVRDHYARLSVETQDSVQANIAASLKFMLKQAERRLKDRQEELKANSDLSAADLRKGLDEAQKEFTKVQARELRGQASRARELRKQFEAARLAGPYFPLGRFGQYFVTVRDDDGHVVSFSRFESLSEQRRYMKEMTARGLDVKHGMLADDATDAGQVDPNFVAKIDALMVESGGDHAMRDALWQAYLTTLPDFSMRKRFIHRKGTPGHHKDALRVFASTTFHAGHQLARLKHGMALKNYLEELKVEASNAADPVRAMAVWKEMSAAHEFVMNPVAAPIAQMATSAVFIFYMGLRLSTAMVNIEQSFSKGIPILSSNTGLTESPINISMAAAAREISRGYSDVVRGKGFADKSARLTGDERRALEIGYEGGTIDRTMSHDVAGVAESGVEYNHYHHTVMTILSAPMHHTERVNREATYLAAFRVAQKAGRTFGESIRFAKDITWSTHYDNQSTSKPRMMRSNVGRVFFALRSFVVNTLYRLARDMHQSLKGETAEIRRASAKRFVGMLGATFVMAGFKGMVGWSLIKMAATAVLSAFGLIGSEDDLEELLRRSMLNAVKDIPLASSVVGMAFDGVPGYLTGVELSNRIGMADLFIQGGNRDQKGDSAMLDMTLGLLGPTASLGINWLRGMNDVGSGDVERGLEKLVPAVVRDVMKTGRYAAEGVTNRRGDEIMESVPIQDLMKQALGFTPASIAERYDRANYLFNMKSRIADLKRDAVREFVQAKGDPAAQRSALEKITRYNQLFPESAISATNLRSAISGPERRAQRTNMGVDVPAKMQKRAMDQRAPLLYSADE
jgi:N12 class adenine-specific DNA methylase